MSDELWALGSDNQVFTENGRLVARFITTSDAQEVIDDHNLGVEMDRPPEPEEVKSLE